MEYVDDTAVEQCNTPHLRKPQACSCKIESALNHRHPWIQQIGVGDGRQRFFTLRAFAGQHWVSRPLVQSWCRGARRLTLRPGGTCFLVALRVDGMMQEGHAVSVLLCQHLAKLAAFVGVLGTPPKANTGGIC